MATLEKKVSKSKAEESTTKTKATAKKTSKGAKSTAKSTKAKKSVLVVVESPAKAKTIEKYLGAGYTVKASMGHLIDLPKSRIAIDPENNFQTDYITVRGRASILKD